MNVFVMVPMLSAELWYFTTASNCWLQSKDVVTISLMKTALQDVYVQSSQVSNVFNYYLVNLNLNIMWHWRADSNSK